MQSVPITTKVVSSKPVHDEVYSMPHYVIKLIVSDLGTPVSSTNKIAGQNITEILMKVLLNTIKKQTKSI
jgi:uncharacterized protein YcfJ